MSQHFYLLLLEPTVGVVERLLPRRVAGAGIVIVVLELPPEPILPVIFCVSKHSFHLGKTSLAFRNAAEFRHHASTFESFYNPVPVLHVEGIKDMALKL